MQAPLFAVSDLSYPEAMQNALPDSERVIPKLSDVAAYKANCDAIDMLVGECRYPYIVAWGKFLGFSPETVKQYVDQAETDNAPAEAIQKFGDGWMVLSSIKDERNRSRVSDLARR